MHSLSFLNNCLIYDQWTSHKAFNVKYNKISFFFIFDFLKSVDDNVFILPLIEFCWFTNLFINFSKFKNNTKVVELISNSFPEFISIFSVNIKWNTTKLINVICKLKSWSRWKHLHIYNSFVILFLKRYKKMNLIWPLGVGFMVAMKYAFNILSASFFLVSFQVFLQMIYGWYFHLNN